MHKLLSGQNFLSTANLSLKLAISHCLAKNGGAESIAEMSDLLNYFTSSKSLINSAAFFQKVLTNRDSSNHIGTLATLINSDKVTK